MKVLHKIVLGGILLTMVFIFSGCTASKRHAIAEGQLYQSFCPDNVYYEELPDQMRRVAILPIYSEDLEGELIENLDKVFAAELNKISQFEVVPVSRYDLQEMFDVYQLSSVKRLPPSFMQDMYDYYGVDGIMFVDLTNYRPYRPISVGVRNKLVDVRNGEVIWAFDTVFDSGNPHVAVSARRYQQCSYRGGYLIDSGGSVLRSPIVFSQYVASESFRAIPKRKVEICEESDENH